ncbi:predicted ABC-type transport system [Vibrio astriarenae]|nr:predicted ABC-type transport system [Vibrio sp. C7]
MTTSVIKASSVNHIVSTKQEQLTILSDVSLSIDKGETVAIIGSSGAGKSTLMSLLAGLDTPTTGSIELMGKSLEG